MCYILVCTWVEHKRHVAVTFVSINRFVSPNIWAQSGHQTITCTFTYNPWYITLKYLQETIETETMLEVGTNIADKFNQLSISEDKWLETPAYTIPSLKKVTTAVSHVSVYSTIITMFSFCVTLGLHHFLSDMTRPSYRCLSLPY